MPIMMPHSCLNIGVWSELLAGHGAIEQINVVASGKPVSGRWRRLGAAARCPGGSAHDGGDALNERRTGSRTSLIIPVCVKFTMDTGTVEPTLSLSS